MAIPSQTEPEIAVLRGLTWEQYLAVVDVLAEHHTRHHYAHGDLELNNPVNGVTWPQYLAFLEAIGDTYCRHNYANETLEMMSPRKDHDWVKRFMGRIIETIAYELDIEIQCIGSTTITSQAVSRGFQPDEAYYIANERLVRGKDTFEPDIDPPPDLLLEVDVTSSSKGRLESFAAMKVPEVWRYSHDEIQFLRLNKEGIYVAVEKSPSLPMLTPSDIVECFELLGTLSENHVLKTLVAKLRERR